MPELTLAANRIKTAASLAAKQYMGVSDTLKGALRTDQIMQHEVDGETRDLPHPRRVPGPREARVLRPRG